MKIKFLAGAGKVKYNIQGNVIEGIDTSFFIKGSQFVGSEETQAAGIFDMFWQYDELHIVLAQPTATSGVPWAARDGGWIDAADYIPGERYVVATNEDALKLISDGKAEYALIAGKWTVRMIEAEEQESAA